MIGPEQRKILEFVALHKLEGEIGDLVVEGVGDAAVFASFLEASGRQARVWPVDALEVPEETSSRHGTAGGNRGRVQSVALEFDLHLGPSGGRVRCVADSDTDLWIGSQRESSHLLYTDYTSLDLYAFSVEPLGKMLRTVMPGATPDAVEVLEALTPPLTELFLFRVLPRRLDLQMRRLDPRRSCRRARSGITFDLEGYLRKVLDANDLRRQEDRIRAELDALRDRQGSDVRKRIDGRDFVLLLSLYLRPYVKNKHFADPEVVARLLRTSLDSAALGREPLFRELLEIMPPVR